MFTPETLYAARGNFNSTPYGVANSINMYSSQDTLAQIVPGYFPDNFGLAEGIIKVGDVIFLSMSDIRLIGNVTSVVPIGINTYTDIPDNLVTEETTTQSNAYTGVFLSPVDVMLDFDKQNKQALLTLPSVSDLSTGGASIDLVAPLIPSCFPAYEVNVPALVQDNNVYELGYVKLRTDGTVSIYRANDVAFGAFGNAGLLAIPISYKTVGI